MHESSNAGCRIAIRRMCQMVPVLCLLFCAAASGRAAVTLTTNSFSAFTNALAGGGLINLAFNGIITATNSFQIVSNTTLNASGHSVLISGVGNGRVFTIPAGVVFSATNLMIANGSAAGANGATGGPSGGTGGGGATGEGGAIFNQGTDYLISCILSNNLALGGNGGNGATNPLDNSGYGGVGGGGGIAFGGAIYNSSLVVLSNCTFIGNKAIGGNGGIGGTGSSGAGTGGGGGPAEGAVIYDTVNASSFITGCIFSNNTVQGGTSQPAGPAPTGNTGRSGLPGGDAYGGCICNLGTNILNSCIFSSNLVTGGNGGIGGPNSYAGGAGGNGGNAYGADLYNAGFLGATNCTFSNNAAYGASGTNGGSGPGYGPGQGGFGGTGAGGGLYNLSGANAIFFACTFNHNLAQAGSSGNTAPYGDNDGNQGTTGGSAGGGGIYNLGTNTLVNCTFYENAAVGGTGGSGSTNSNKGGIGGTGGTASGGALYNAAVMNVTNCTLAGSAASGGAAGPAGSGPDGSYPYAGSAGSAYGANAGTFSGTLEIENSIIAYPTNAANAYGTFTDAGNNLSSDATPAFGTNSHNSLDPKLGLLAANGGPTLTLALLGDSPAINGGNDSVTNFLSTDQRGLPRVSGTHVDIGAFELQIVIPYITSFTVSASGEFQLQFNGTVGATYEVLSSTDLNLKLSAWAVLGTAISPSPGVFQFLDTLAPASGRFFQVRSQ